MTQYKIRDTSSDDEFDRKVKLKRDLRDQFAMAALPAMINQYPHICKSMIADDCYAYADAMLRSREIKGEQNEND